MVKWNSRETAIIKTISFVRPFINFPKDRSAKSGLSDSQVCFRQKFLTKAIFLQFHYFS